jgi:allantoicase
MKIRDCYDKIAKINLDIFKLVIEKQSFKDVIERIRKNFNIPLNGFEDLKIVEQWWYKLAVISENDKIKFSLNNFYKEINDILIDFKLTDNFRNNILHYIIYNQISAPSYNAAIYPGGKNISIVFYGRPTKCEWQELKRQVELFLNLSSKKKYRFLKGQNYPFGDKVLKPKRNIDRDLKIIRLSKKKGEKILDISTRKYIGNYNDKSIEAEVWESESVKESMNNEKIIRKVRERIKKK